MTSPIFPRKWEPATGNFSSWTAAGEGSPSGIRAADEPWSRCDRRRGFLFGMENDKTDKTLYIYTRLMNNNLLQFCYN